MILAVKRKPRIKGRSLVLISSIIDIKDPTKYGNPVGVWWEKKELILEVNQENKAAPHKLNLRGKIIYICFWRGTQEPSKPKRLKKDNKRKIFSPNKNLDLNLRKGPENKKKSNLLSEKNSLGEIRRIKKVSVV